MNLIAKPRGEGKTFDIVNKCHKEGGYIVCFSRQEARRVFMFAQELKKQIRMPITFQELLAGEYHGPGVGRFHIDNLDMCLQSVIQVEISTISVNSAESVRPTKATAGKKGNV